MIVALVALCASAKPPADLEGLQQVPLPNTEGVAPTAPPVGVDPLFQELLGASPPAETSPPTGSPSAEWAAPSLGGLWPLGLAGVGAALVWAASRYRRATTSELLVVVGRTGLGANQAGLVLVDVKDPTGQWRRLLIGTGSGVPALVADLGEDLAELEETRNGIGRPEPIPTHQPPPSFRRPARAPLLADPERKAQARALIAEVVQSRLAAGER